MIRFLDDLRPAHVLRCGALLLFALVGAAAQAQSATWPSRPVRLVVPFVAGGSADTLGRLVAQKLAESLKQPFVVENRGGAGGLVGSEIVARAAPDGYTLVVSGIASHVLAPAIARATFCLLYTSPSPRD